MTPFKTALLCAAALAVATPAAADHHETAGHENHGGAEAGTSASDAFRAANHKMHAAMSKPLSGDADADFLRGMIPHHEGALEMARIELKHGKNADARDLAQRIVAAQEREIAEMKALLARIETSPQK